ncbi:MAG: hypothetical protein M2R45_02830 [Verrucomicrobia subdivision 3 bacterium]|nr:hypothetical protein [Limisphaerales bacterium]MCS1415467.1 hypothetical protein [Limisphaerales bacterium]
MGCSCQLGHGRVFDLARQHHDKTVHLFLTGWFHGPQALIAAPDEIVPAYDELKDKAATYSKTINNTNQAIGRLLSHLRDIDSVENTLIIYASDNGSYRDDRTGSLRSRRGMNRGEWYLPARNLFVDGNDLSLLVKGDCGTLPSPAVVT